MNKPRTWHIDLITLPNQNHSQKELEGLLHYTNTKPKWDDELTEEDMEARQNFPWVYEQLKEIERQLSEHIISTRNNKGGRSKYIR